MPQNGQNLNGQQNFNQQQQNQYYEEEEEPVDEDGVPLPSPEEIKNIINSIPSFKFEEKKQNSSSKEPENKDSCAICLDDL